MWIDVRRKIFHRRALSVRDACKRYGQKSIISNLNMTVPEGAIYALLGASGCGNFLILTSAYLEFAIFLGKTTLLSCCVGIKKLDSGQIEIFGYEPASDNSGVPGSRCGLMPQEISLFDEFSMREALTYFGRIYGMSYDKIEERMCFLCTLLKLPNDYDRLIRNLSGGQQRRISFAVALIHEPELLILDEPTVGVDPLLRKTIWEYLKQLSTTNKTTIIVTTHFIEEANESSIIGLMRNGRLITEDTPKNLKQFHQTDLEDIVLKLCIIDSENDTDNPSETIVQKRVIDSMDDRNYSRIKIPWNELAGPTDRLLALVHRNFIRMLRNIGYMAFLFIFPASGVLFFCLAVGGKITYLHFGLINHEILNGTCGPVGNGCIISNISCKFLSTFEDDSFIWIHFENEKEAHDAVLAGDIWGYLFIPQNFSKNFPSSDDKDAGDRNKMLIRMDMTNQQIALSIRKNVYEAFQDFLKDWFEDCFIDSDFLEFPLVWGDPIYGENNVDFKEYMGPSVHLCQLFFMSTSLTGLVFIIEKKQGMFERSLVAGVTRNEVILSHFISQYCVLIIQIFFALIILLVIFELPVKGSLLAVIVLSLLQGTIGILLGFLFSALCTEESTVLQISIGTVIPNTILSGVIWPLEGMPLIMQYFCLFTPSTLPCVSIRCIMSRGWPVTHPKVWVGFASNIVWILIIWSIIFCINRFLVRKM